MAMTTDRMREQSLGIQWPVLPNPYCLTVAVDGSRPTRRRARHAAADLARTRARAGGVRPVESSGKSALIRPRPAMSRRASVG